jgi:hypothetical protein
MSLVLVPSQIHYSERVQDIKGLFCTAVPVGQLGNSVCDPYGVHAANDRVSSVWGSGFYDLKNMERGLTPACLVVSTLLPWRSHTLHLCLFPYYPPAASPAL